MPLHRIFCAMIISTVCISCISTPSTATSTSNEDDFYFDPERAQQSIELESNWPPLENLSYQSAWLEVLQRIGFRASSYPSEVTSVIPFSLGHFCDAPLAVRETLFGTRNSRLTRDGNEKFRALFMSTCNIHVFFSQRSNSRLYVLVFNNTTGVAPARIVYNDPRGPDLLVIHRSSATVTASGEADVVAADIAQEEYVRWIALHRGGTLPAPHPSDAATIRSSSRS